MRLCMGRVSVRLAAVVSASNTNYMIVLMRLIVCAVVVHVNDSNPSTAFAHYISYHDNRQDHFREAFSDRIARGHHRDSTSSEKKMAAALTTELRRRCQPFVLRRDKASVSLASASSQGEGGEETQLSSSTASASSEGVSTAVGVSGAKSSVAAKGISIPKARDWIVWLPLTTQQGHEYLKALAETRAELQNPGPGKHKRGILALLMELRQLCNSARGVRSIDGELCSVPSPPMGSFSSSSSSSSSMAMRSPLGSLSPGENDLSQFSTPSSKGTRGGSNTIENGDDGLGGASSLLRRSCKMQFLRKLLQQFRNEGHRVLIFSKWRTTLDLIEEAVLEGSESRWLRLDGKVKDPIERHRRVRLFNKKKKYGVFLLTTQVGGVGLTLTGANRVVIFEPAWNPASDNQAVDRACRIGQKQQVVIYRLITCNTLEESIYRRQVYKGGICRSIIGPEAVKTAKGRGAGGAKGGAQPDDAALGTLFDDEASSANDFDAATSSDTYRYFRSDELKEMCHPQSMATLGSSKTFTALHKLHPVGGSSGSNGSNGSGGSGGGSVAMVAAKEDDAKSPNDRELAWLRRQIVSGKSSILGYSSSGILGFTDHTKLFSVAPEDIADRDDEDGGDNDENQRRTGGGRGGNGKSRSSQISAKSVVEAARMAGEGLMTPSRKTIMQRFKQMNVAKEACLGNLGAGGDDDASRDEFLRLDSLQAELKRIQDDMDMPEGGGARGSGGGGAVGGGAAAVVDLVGGAGSVSTNNTGAIDAPSTPSIGERMLRVNRLFYATPGGHKRKASARKAPSSHLRGLGGGEGGVAGRSESSDDSGVVVVVDDESPSATGVGAEGGDGTVIDISDADDSAAAAGSVVDDPILSLEDRHALVVELIEEFNRTVFEGKLPPDQEVTWNTRLSSTAGLTRFKMSDDGGPFRRVAPVELSPALLDRSLRIRQTLMHELCHAAQWVVHGCSRSKCKCGPHGSHFLYWAQRARYQYGNEMVTRCHNYLVDGASEGKRE